MTWLFDFLMKVFFFLQEYLKKFHKEPPLYFATSKLNRFNTEIVAERAGNGFSGSFYINSEARIGAGMSSEAD